jgi:hypothetical protein
VRQDFVQTEPKKKCQTRSHACGFQAKPFLTSLHRNVYLTSGDGADFLAFLRALLQIGAKTGTALFDENF